MKKKIMLLFIVFLFATLSAFADTITLKSGKQIEGKILERTGDTVKIDFSGVELTYFLDDIEQINGEKVTLPVPEAVPAVPARIEQKTAVSREAAPPVKAVSMDISGVAREGKLVEKISRKGNPGPKSPLPAMALAGIFAGGVVFIFAILIYVYLCLCIQLIAKKTNQEPAWLAWIPIANLYLMCKIAAIDARWMLIIFAGFIPIIGAIANLAFIGFLWYKIALVRNKPGWMGVLCVIPLVNLVVMGYLAFSD